MGNGPSLAATGSQSSSQVSANTKRALFSATSQNSTTAAAATTIAAAPPHKKKYASGNSSSGDDSSLHHWNTATHAHVGHGALSQMFEAVQGDDLQLRMRSTTLSDRPGDSITAAKLPTVFKWTGAGKEVFISGSFNNWTAKIPLVKSQGNFYTILELPEGKHEYKFIVDGHWSSDPSQPSVSNDKGTCNNVLEVKSTDFEVFEALAMDMADSVTSSASSHNVTGAGGESSDAAASSSVRERHRSNSPFGCYTRDIPAYSRSSHHSVDSTMFSARRSSPPTLPPHLLQAILNHDTSDNYDPNLLPPPAHVMLNHLYALSIKDGVLVLSSCFRYRKKYISTILYKPT